MSDEGRSEGTIFFTEDLLPGDLYGIVKRAWVELKKRLLMLYNTAVQDSG